MRRRFAAALVALLIAAAPLLLPMCGTLCAAPRVAHSCHETTRPNTAIGAGVHTCDRAGDNPSESLRAGKLVAAPAVSRARLHDFALAHTTIADALSRTPAQNLLQLIIPLRI